MAEKCERPLWRGAGREVQRRLVMRRPKPAECQGQTMRASMRVKSEFSAPRKGNNHLSEPEARRQRQSWGEDILRFHTMSAGAVETWIIEAEKLPTLLAAASEGVPVAKAIVSVIGQWLEYAKSMHPSLPALCMNCDTVMRPPDSLPETFIVHLPFANPKGALVNAVCSSCAHNGTDWRTRSLQMLKQIFPDAYRAEYPSSAQ